MNAKRYSTIGLLIWKGGKWYLRRTYLRRLPSRRTIALTGGGVLAATGGALAAAHAVRGHR